MNMVYGFVFCVYYNQSLFKHGLEIMFLKTLCVGEYARHEEYTEMSTDWPLDKRNLYLNDRKAAIHNLQRNGSIVIVV